MLKVVARASSEVNGFAELLQRFERNISILGRSPRTFDNYSRHVAALALHFKTLPTELDPEQVKDYLFELQKRSKTPSQSYFKHTVYGLRFLLKTEGLPYSYLHLPAIPKVKKLPTILSREEIWRMLQSAELLKHKLLIGLIYGCGLSLHPHLHCIVPGGGTNKQGKWKGKVRTDKYLFPVKALGKVFRAKFAASLKACGIKDADLMDRLFAKNWVVYAKRPFGGPKQVIEYLGRYTHKVAISNHRIKEVTDQQVRFEYKDYRKGGEKKEMTLANTEFVRRFSMHILPKRFVRIRHYGILSSSWKRGKLQALQSDLKIRVTAAKPKTLLRKCRSCKEGNLVTIAVFGQRGPPPEFLFVIQPLSAN